MYKRLFCTVLNIRFEQSKLLRGSCAEIGVFRWKMVLGAFLSSYVSVTFPEGKELQVFQSQPKVFHGVTINLSEI